MTSTKCTCGFDALSPEQPYLTADEQFVPFTVSINRRVPVRLSASVTEDSIYDTVKTSVVGTPVYVQSDEVTPPRASLVFSSDSRYTDYQVLVTKKYQNYNWQDAASAAAALINVTITAFVLFFPVVGLVKRQRIFIFDDPTDKFNHMPPFNDPDAIVTAGSNSSGGGGGNISVVVSSPSAGNGSPAGLNSGVGLTSLSASPMVIDGRPLLASASASAAGDIKSN